MGCSTEMVGVGVPVVLEGLSVELDRNADPTSCYLKFDHTCLQGTAIRYTNLNKTHDLPCDTDSTTGWTYKYIEYITEFFVKVEICTKDFEEPEPEPEPEEGDLTDYQRINNGVLEIADSSVNTLSAYISNIGGLVGGLQGEVVSGFTSITSGLSNLSDAVSGWIGDLQTNLTSQITGVTESLTGGFNNLSDKIDGLTFPCIDSIKGAFLDVCEELAIALWNRIIDEIEKRYPKDEEESD